MESKEDPNNQLVYHVHPTQIPVQIPQSDVVLNVQDTTEEELLDDVEHARHYKTGEGTGMSCPVVYFKHSDHILQELCLIKYSAA